MGVSIGTAVGGRLAEGAVDEGLKLSKRLAPGRVKVEVKREAREGRGEALVLPKYENGLWAYGGDWPGLDGLPLDMEDCWS